MTLLGDWMYTSCSRIKKRVKKPEVEKVSFILRGRGFSSRGGFESLYPLPEKPEETLPLSYLETVQEAINSYRTSDGSGCSSPTTDNTNSLNNSLWASNTWSTNTGNLTGRSSVYSWGNDDEFDRQASATVQRMFDEISQMLFEGKFFDGSPQLLSECREWCTKFPHLRICGDQCAVPQDQGTKYIPLPPDDPRVYNYRPQTSVLEDMEEVNTLDSQGLTVQGTKLKPVRVDVSEYQDLSDSDDENPLAELEEEIFGEEGEFEEYLAYDFPALDEELMVLRSRHNRRKRHFRLGFPPVTPNACARDTLFSQMFDLLWGEIVLWLRTLLVQHSQKFLRDKPLYLPDAVRQPERAIDSPLRPISRDVSSRISYFPSQFRLRTSTSLNPPLDVKGLKDVMMIKSLALQHRAPSAAAIHPIDSREGTPYIQGRPGSSSTVASRMSRFGRVPDNFLNRMASAKTRRNPASQRLAPLERERPKTPNTQEDVKCEIVRGTKLLPGGERLTSPPHPLNTSSPQPWGARNGTLPPLERTVSYGESTAAVSTLVSASTTGSSNQTLHSAARSSAKAKVHFNVRASSAATDDSRRSLRERAPVFSESRPNTTHSFRTDTPSANANNRRLSTPMNNFNHSRGVLGTNRQPLDLGGITGVSMSISAGPPGSDLHTSHSGHHGDSRGISPISDEADDVESYFGHAGHQRRGRLGTIR